ncbi:hypothetical protein GCM10011332_21120 [Terasakiella brassicae]|uniref:Uncharacterized protein n=1 Tax=Terasakiella brassicae TaxID=1634917 RepID=A0A917C1V9_9PROT|nr:hypothetical protein [Terasakiella brassicae]GGF66776.1 hypothetical protein GCM10011332_21120 [Terasakiella brassicae]
MNRYKNLGGDSGVIGYSIEVDSIEVQFHDGSIYGYTVASTGLANINKMKILAERGEGLNSFISRVVKKNFAYKR